jgi:hypothetical protein
MSNPIGELISDSEPEPEPAGLNLYAQEALDLSCNLPEDARSVDWLSDCGNSRIILRPKRIQANLSKKAFENYAAFSIDERHRLEYATSLAMSEIDGDAQWHDMYVMVNHVPLLFTRDNMVRGYREWQGDSMLLRSDKLHDEHQRHILIGGLATILYYTDYPNALKTVE